MDAEAMLFMASHNLLGENVGGVLTAWPRRQVPTRSEHRAASTSFPKGLIREQLFAEVLAVPEIL
jgi:hypothetical protein